MSPQAVLKKKSSLYVELSPNPRIEKINFSKTAENSLKAELQRKITKYR